MASPPAPPRRAGGFLLIVALLAGVVIGIHRGQPMAGTLIGFGVGVAAAVVVWLLDRR